MTRFLSEKGFSLVELMVTVGIITVVMAGAVGGYYSFVKSTRGTISESKNTSNVKVALKLLQRDLNMAGYGLPRATRVASGDGQQAISEAVACGFDCYNHTSGEMVADGDTTDTIPTDRIFIANGWEILRDVTDNGADDGNIVTGTPDYYTAIATVGENGGYYAPLTAAIAANDAIVNINRPDINFDGAVLGALNPTVVDKDGLPDEFTPDYDFNSDAAVIVYGPDGGGVFHVEGHRVSGTTPTLSGTATNPLSTTISLLSGEIFVNAFTIAPPLTTNSMVVPAIAWYVAQRAGDDVPWLYRNEDKLIPNVVNLQFQYGFDINRDGLEWFDTIPPATALEVRVLPPDPGENRPDQKILALKSVRVTLTLKRTGETSTVLKTYQEVINLKN